ncbi:MAG: hypothetical protein JSS02_17935 [Planctomycetes bacterium]|nr:hypothetical protein [Planctomycetota bacterium]
MHATFTEIDFIEEIRLRCWARENYAPRDRRDATWHRVILDEMGVRDQELRADSAEAETVFENLAT